MKLNNHEKNFEIAFSTLHRVTEILELKSDIEPATIVQSLSAIIAIYTTSQPNPESALKSVINYLKESVEKCGLLKKRCSIKKNNLSFRVIKK